MPSVCRHFQTKAHSLNSRSGYTERDQLISSCLSPSLAQRSIVFLRAALVCKAGQNDIVRRSLHEICDFPQLAGLGGLDVGAIIGKVDWRKLVSRYITAEERRAFLDRKSVV